MVFAVLWSFRSLTVQHAPWFASYIHPLIHIFDGLFDVSVDRVRSCLENVHQCFFLVVIVFLMVLIAS